MAWVWHMLWILILLLGWGYGMFTGVKRAVYNRLGYRTSGSLPTLVVGNLSVGGTGKTPMVLFLMRAFSTERVGVLSRGYARDTKGYVKVSGESSAKDVGDEALEIFNSLDNPVVRVCENRLAGLTQMKREAEVDWVILDDGYQHVALQPDKAVILTDFNRPFWKERFSLPVGNLREFPGALLEAQALVITKCPVDLSRERAAEIRSEIDFDSERIFFAHYRQSQPVCIGGSSVEQRALLVSGIAQKKGLQEEIRGWEIVGHLPYGDHQSFTTKDVHYWLKTCKEMNVYSLILTRKDVQRLTHNELSNMLLNEGISIYEIHTDVEILWNQKSELLALIHP
jgi:tetraacyldisaccharide 4'-kinase